MRIPSPALPWNRNFGIFRLILFVLVASLTYREGSVLLAELFALADMPLTALAFEIPEALLPLNKAWLRFGLLLGSLVDLIVLAFISFLVITLLGILIRIFSCLLSNGRIISSLPTILQHCSYRITLQTSKFRQQRYDELACKVAQLI